MRQNQMKMKSVAKILLLSLVCVTVMASGCSPHKSDQKSPASTETLITLAPLPTPEPRPDFIGDVSPPESSTIPLNVYQVNINEHAIHEGVRSEDMGFANSICVAIDTGPVLESGDKLVDWRNVLNRVSVRADGTLLTDVVYTIWYNILTYNEAEDAEGIGWVVYCWQADLGVGNHEIAVQFSQTSGNIQEYKWYFAITSEEVPLSTDVPRPRTAREYNSTIDHIPLCDEPSPLSSPQVSYHGVIPGQTTMAQLYAQFDDLVNLRRRLEPPGTDWWFAMIGDKVNADIETRNGIVNWIDVGGTGFDNSISIAEVVKKCGDPDIVFITTLHKRRVHLVYLEYGLEVNAFKSSSLSLSDEILGVRYFQPSTPEEFWELNRNALSDTLIEEVSWKDVLPPTKDEHLTVTVVLAISVLVLIIGIIFGYLRRRQKVYNSE